jgi:hypothetical protein
MNWIIHRLEKSEPSSQALILQWKALTILHLSRCNKSCWTTHHLGTGKEKADRKSQPILLQGKTFTMLHISSCSLHCWITHHLGAGIEKAEPNTHIPRKEDLQNVAF